MPQYFDDWDTESSSEYSGTEVLESCKRSILPGARAGITSGAYGVWNWFRNSGLTGGFATKLYSNTPTWKEALHFPAAGEIADLRKLAY